ncbi:MAG: signal peptidase I [Treponema sp.]|nr:signal peptidase I [Treponema sp.]
MSKNTNIYEISYSLKQERRRFYHRAIFIVVAFFVVMNALLSFVICPVQQKSASMEPNVPSGTCVFATPIGKKIKRGEIIIIAQNEKKLTFKQKVCDLIAGAFTFQKVHPWTNEKSLMRRAVGLPGDTLYMKDYILYVQPKNEKHFFTEFELNQVPYSVDIRVPPAGWNPEIGVRGSFDTITLGENEYYVLGDNRLSCADSRLFGKISGSKIQKRVLMSYYPLKQIKFLQFKK